MIHTCYHVQVCLRFATVEHKLRSRHSDENMGNKEASSHPRQMKENSLVSTPYWVPSCPCHNSFGRGTTGYRESPTTWLHSIPHWAPSQFCSARLTGPSHHPLSRQGEPPTTSQNPTPLRSPGTFVPGTEPPATVGGFAVILTVRHPAIES